MKQVRADAQEKPEPGDAKIKSAQQAAYRALIGLASGHLESQGRQLRLVPGMQVNPEIHFAQARAGTVGWGNYLQDAASTAFRLRGEAGAMKCRQDT